MGMSTGACCGQPRGQWELASSFFVETEVACSFDVGLPEHKHLLFSRPLASWPVRGQAACSPLSLIRLKRSRNYGLRVR